jgi:hypothetical protein
MEPTNAQIEWRKYLAEEISEDQYNAKNVFLSNEELTLKDIPDSTTSDEKIFNFVRTYLPVRDKFVNHVTDLSLYYNQYVYEGKHKGSVKNFRGVMYFIWRADRFTSTFNFKLTNAYYRAIIEDIRTIVEFTDKNRECLKRKLN